jgi:hypothetical protein
MRRLIAVLFLGSLALPAQTNRGAIVGTITDQSQAVVPGAAITVTNIGTNETRRLKTAGNGLFSVLDLEPVNYRLEIEAAGFKRSILPNVKVDTGQTTTANVSLETGSVETKVTVTTEAPAIDTHSGVTSSTVTERQIQDAPLLNRSVLDLAMTLPNVAGDAGSEDPVLSTVTPCPGCNLSLGGGRPLSTLLLADGANNTGVSLARTIVSFSPETVQEFTVQTSAFSAEFGTTGGGVVNATTKSGTNELRGTVLWYNRNPRFAAGPYTMATQYRPLPTLKYNQFSLAAGGPVVIPKVYKGRNRTFWFAAIEPRYRRDRLDQYGVVPTDAMRNGDFSGMVNTVSGWLPQSVVDRFRSVAPSAVASAGESTLYNNYDMVGTQFTKANLPAGQTSYLPFPCNVIPKSMLDASALKTLPYIAKASDFYLDGNGYIADIFGPRLLSQDETRYTARVDHAIADSNRIYGRFTATPIVKLQTTPISPTNGFAIYSWGAQAMIADTHMISATTFNDLRLNYTRGKFSQTLSPEYDVRTGQNLNTLLGLPSLSKGGLPALQGLFISRARGSGTGGGSGNSIGTANPVGANDNREERYALTDIVYRTSGKMSWKIGGDYSRSLQNVIPLYGTYGGIYPFAATQTNSNGAGSGTGGHIFASFLLGVPNGNVTLATAQVPYYYRWTSGAAFVQNDWKVAPNLTLNLGLRWSLQMPRSEKYNHQGVFRPDLAKTYPLPTPLTLATGQVVTSATVPPFAFSGLGNNSRYLTPPQYRDFEPRFGFAWQPKFLTSRRMVIRGGYGLAHTPIGGFSQMPQPGFGATTPFASATPSGTALPQYVMRLGSNPPQLTPRTPTQAIYGSNNPPSDGLVYLGSLYYLGLLPTASAPASGGFAVSQNYRTPYVQNWNFTLSWQATPSTSVEVAYTGAMGIHLFMSQEDLNPINSDVVTAQLAQNLNTVSTISDPLGRVDPNTGRVMAVQYGHLGSPYLGFSSLYQWFDSAGNSIRHAGYVSVVRRASRGLTFNANYTYGKSIDTGSSGGVDNNVLSAVNGQVRGQVVFGGTRQMDRSVSTYDQRHVIHGSAIYDLPFGRGQRFLNGAWRPVRMAVEGWSMSWLLRFNSGFPYTVYLTDSNQLGDAVYSARPNITPGEPIVNPLWSRNCPISNSCQPYLNPAAFQRPPVGRFGNAPRTLDYARGPFQHYADFSLQKNFKLGESGKRRVQIRVDALNLFNHPTFAVYPNNYGGAQFMSAPSTGTLTTAAYNTWATYNNQPQYSATVGSPGYSQYNQIVNMVNAQRNRLSALPADFFTVPLPTNFFGTNANAFDIRTLGGYKLYQLRTSYVANFGDLYNNGTPRYVQFGLKFYF